MSRLAELPDAVMETEPRFDAAPLGRLCVDLGCEPIRELARRSRSG